MRSVLASLRCELRQGGSLRVAHEPHTELILHLDALTGVAPIAETMQQTQTDHLLQRLTGAGLDTAFGLFVIATVLASAGYLVSSFVWRLLVARKRARRLAEARLREPAG